MSLRESCLCGYISKSSRGLANHRRNCKVFHDALKRPAALLAARTAPQRRHVVQASTEVIRHTIQEEPSPSLHFEAEEPFIHASNTTNDIQMVCSVFLLLLFNLIYNQNDIVEPEIQPVEHYASGRPKRSMRARCLPARYQDKLPPVPLDIFQQETVVDNTHVTPDVPEIAETMEVDRPSPGPDDVPVFNTKKDTYGVYHSFLHQFPSFVPRGALEFICDSPNFDVTTPKRDWWAGFATSQPLNELDQADEAPKDTPQWQAYKDALAKINYFSPFPNPSTYLLMDWFYSQSNSKTLAELDRLVKTVILDKDFNPEHLEGFNATREAQRLDAIQDTELGETMFRADDGWNQASVEISVPFEHVKNTSESEAPKLKVDSLFYRRLLEVIKAALSDTGTEHFHFYPHQTYWQPDATGTPERVYSELYNSDVYIEEHERIRNAHKISKYEIVIVAMMFWSDSTQLANFGTASLWPIYLFLGNQSKYLRCLRSAFAAHHLAYIPKV